MTTSTPRFDTSAYVAAHAREPRGRGAWMFFADRAQTVVVCTTRSCTFAEAKRVARAAAKEQGVPVVFVGS